MPLKILLLVAIFLIPMIPTFWAILDIPKRQFPTWKSKVIWFAVVSTLPVIGAMLYIFFVRRKTQPIRSPEPSTTLEEEIKTDA
ncbi:MAG: PLDc N-terminal domain-containing protein [Syntrophobacteraceae bacterium]